MSHRNEGASLGAHFRELRRQKFPPDPAHPVESALREKYYDFEQACIDSGSGLTKLLTWDWNKGIPQDWKDYYELFRQAMEIRTWAFDPVEEESEDAEAERLRLMGLTFSQTRAFMNFSRRTPPGRPHRKRRLAVQVYEIRLKDEKSWPWSRLAQKLCDCGAKRHGEKCQERLRKEVGHLKALLKKHKVEVR